MGSWTFPRSERVAVDRSKPRTRKHLHHACRGCVFWQAGCQWLAHRASGVVGGCGLPDVAAPMWALF